MEVCPTHVATMELVNSLSDYSLSLEDRLKVSCYLWRQDHVLASQRNHFLLEWACQEVCRAYNKKIKRSPPLAAIGKLWAFLGRLLKILVAEDSVQELPSLNQHLFQAVGVAFTSAAQHIERSPDDGQMVCADQMVCTREALDCLYQIFQLSKFPSALGIFETVVALLESLLLLGVAYFSHTHQQPQPLLLLTLKCGLDYYAYLESTQGNPKKVFTATCQQVLCPSLRLHRLLLSSETPYQEGGANGDQVTTVIDALKNIFKSLFRSEFLSEFSSTLSISSTPEGDQATPPSRTAVSSTRVLFDVLSEFLGANSDQSGVEALPLFLEAFLHENSVASKVPKNIEFNFFIRILHLLKIMDENAAASVNTDTNTDSNTDTNTGTNTVDPGSDPSTEDLCEVLVKYFKRKKGKKAAKANSLRLKACRRCLQLLLEYQVYQVAEDLGTSEQKQTRYFKSLVRHIMKELRPGTVELYCGCLCEVLKLNHLLLEPWLSVVWTIAPATTSQSEELLNTCIDTYSRLRQLPALLEKQLAASALLNTLTPTPPQLLTPSLLFSASSESLLATRLSSLPPGQATAVLELYTQHLQQITSTSSCPASRLGVWHSVQVLSVVLSHLPLAVWTTRSGGVATQLTRTLVEEVCDKMLTVAKGELEAHSATPPDDTPATPPDDFLVTSALLLTTQCLQLLTCLQPHLPPSALPRFPLHLHMTSSGQLLPRHWEGVASPRQPVAKYLLRDLAIQEWRAGQLNKGEESEEEAGLREESRKQLLDFIFLSEEFKPSTLEKWNGQVLTLTADTYSVGYSALLLSHLPCLYESCTEQHLQTVADIILTSLALPNLPDLPDLPEALPHQQAGEEGVDPALDLRSVAQGFLQSECFLEMRRLYEVLITQYLSPVKGKSLGKPLRSTLRLCSEDSSTLKEGCATAIADVVKYGLTDVLGIISPCPCNYSYHKLMCKWRLGIYLELVQVLPLSCMKVSLLLKYFLTGLVYHVALLHVLVQEGVAQEGVAQEAVTQGEEEQEGVPQKEEGVAHERAEEKKDMLCSLRTLTSLLSWQLHALLSVSGSRKKVRDSCVGVAQLDNLLGWWYRVMSHVYSCQPHAQICDVLSSLMVAMETTLVVRLTHHGYPEVFAYDVMTDLQNPDEGWVDGQVLICLLDVTSKCKIEDHTPLHSLCHTVLEDLEQVLSLSAPSALFTRQPHLPSLLARLLTFDPMTQSDPRTNMRRIARQLWTAASDKMWVGLGGVPLQGDNITLSHLCCFDQFSGVLDCLTIRLLTMVAIPPSADMETEQAEGSGMELDLDLAREVAYDVLECTGIVDTGEYGCTIPELLAMKAREWKRRKKQADLAEKSLPDLLTLWNILQQVLSRLLGQLDREMCERALSILLDLGMKGGAWQDPGEREEGRRELIFEMAVEKMCAQFSLILKRLKSEDIEALVQKLQQDSVFTWCVCWLLLLGHKCPQHVRTALRPHLHQVLTTCSNIVEQHVSKEHAQHLVVLALQVAVSVLSLPAHVGVDKANSVLEALRLCSLSSDLSHLHSNMVLRCMQVTGQLLSAVLRQHSSVIDHTPAPFLIATNHLVRNVVSVAQDLTPLPTSPLLPSVLHCATLLARVLEMLSHHKSLYRFFPGVLQGFVLASLKAVLHEEVKLAVGYGVGCLLKQCGPPQLAFLQASLDTGGRQYLHSLSQQFNINTARTKI